MSDARQLLGMKGASGTTNIWKLRLQLMKPVTWIPLIWGWSVVQRQVVTTSGGQITCLQPSPAW